MKLAPREIENLNKVPMVFILGKGRSGTSLLQNMMDSNPHIIGGPESRFMQIFYPYFARVKKWTEANILDFVDKLYIEPLFATLWAVDRKELTEALLSAKEKARYPLLCKIVYYQLCKGKTDLIYICDKNPEYTLYIDTLLKIIPDAKFIHIVREPRDNIYSYITSFKYTNVLFQAYRWIGYNSLLEKRKKKDPQRFLTVLYENLVMEPEKNMELVCRFLGISYSNVMAENKKPEWLNEHIQRTGIIDQDKMIHRNLLKPIDKSNIGKWKNKLSPYHQALTEIVTGNFAHKTYGYDIDGNPKNKTVKIPAITLLKGKIIYHLWITFITMKAKSFRVNHFYATLKKKMGKNTPIWEYY